MHLFPRPQSPWFCISDDPFFVSAPRKNCSWSKIFRMAQSHKKYLPFHFSHKNQKSIPTNLSPPLRSGPTPLFCLLTSYLAHQKGKSQSPPISPLPFLPKTWFFLLTPASLCPVLLSNINSLSEISAINLDTILLDLCP